jgi:hypothetical protein
MRLINFCGLIKFGLFQRMNYLKNNYFSKVVQIVFNKILKPMQPNLTYIIKTQRIRSERYINNIFDISRRAPVYYI